MEYIDLGDLSELQSCSFRYNVCAAAQQPTNNGNGGRMYLHSLSAKLDGCWACVFAWADPSPIVQAAYLRKSVTAAGWQVNILMCPPLPVRSSTNGQLIHLSTCSLAMAALVVKSVTDAINGEADAKQVSDGGIEKKSGPTKQDTPPEAAKRLEDDCKCTGSAVVLLDDATQTDVPQDEAVASTPATALPPQTSQIACRVEAPLTPWWYHSLGF